MRDGKVIQIGTPEEIVVSPVDEYVEDFVKGISRLKVVEAKSIMKSKEHYEKENGPIPQNAIEMKENDLLTKLIEESVSNNAPIVVKDNSGNFLGAISQKDLLTSVVEGHDE
jgi:glycine betaine/proline transport system ATP-binding protein